MGVHEATTSGTNATSCPLNHLATAGCSCAALVCVTAIATADPRRQAYLAQAVRAIQGWQVRTSLRVLTNDPPGVRIRLELAGVSAFADPSNQCGGTLKVIKPTSKRYFEKARSSSGNFFLTWAHRDVLEREHFGHDLFVYLEDDMELLWHKVIAWGEDEYLLEQSGSQFHRGFFRWEQRADGSRTVLEGCPFDFAGRHCKLTVSGRLFLGLQEPYYAAWLMTRPRLEALRSSKWWWPNATSDDTIEFDGAVICPWNIRECAASGDAFLGNFSSAGGHVRDCKTSHLVRVETDGGALPRLSELSGLHHLGQNKNRLSPRTWTFQKCIRHGKL